MKKLFLVFLMLVNSAILAGETNYKNILKKYNNSNNYYDVSLLKNGDIDIFFVDPLKYSKPRPNPVNEIGYSLLMLINSAKESINFAIYGISGEDKIINALVDAKKRGVNVRGVTDKDINNVNIYKDTKKLIELLNIHTDYDEDKRMEQYEIKKKRKVWN